MGARVSTCASDRNELAADVATIAAGLDRPGTVLADNGYANGAEVAALEAGGIEALMATAAEDRRRRHNFRPTGAGTAAKGAKAAWLRDMATRLDSQADFLDGINAPFGAVGQTKALIRIWSCRAHQLPSSLCNPPRKRICSSPGASGREPAEWRVAKRAE